MRHLKRGNPKTWKPETRIQNWKAETGIQNPESGIWKPQITENKFFKLVKIILHSFCWQKIRGCERGTLLTGWSTNPTIINRTSLCAPNGLLQQSHRPDDWCNRIYWSKVMRCLTKWFVTKRSKPLLKTKMSIME